ncbi:MAG: MipA/OmpV family protein [Pseudomonadota bacterium]
MKNRSAVTFAIASTLGVGSVGPAAHADGGLFDNLTWTGGGFVSVAPRYEGSKRYRVIGAPFVFPSSGSSSGILDFRGLDEVRFRFINTNRFFGGPVVGYRFGREEKDGNLLGGLGNIDDGAIVGAYAGYLFFEGFLVDATYRFNTSGDVSGGTLRVDGQYKHPLTPELTLTTRAGATFADENFMQANFGVNAVQAATSTAGLGQFNPGTGIKDAHISLRLDAKLSEKWSVNVGGGYSRLLGDAGSSPVIETSNQFRASLGFRYRFGAGGS